MGGSWSIDQRRAGVGSSDKGRLGDIVGQRPQSHFEIHTLVALWLQSAVRM